MFDTDTFIGECVACLSETEPHRAIKEHLTRTMREPEAVAATIAPETAGITMLHHSPELTILDVVWAPGMRVFAHDHRMWAAIGIYTGAEDNAFFRRPVGSRDGLVDSGGKLLETGDVALLGRETIHAVKNPNRTPTGAIHIYGGDFVNERRSQWMAPELREEPYDIEQTRAVFARANEEWRASSA